MINREQFMFKLNVDDEINLCLMHESFAPRYVELAKENFEYLSKWLAWPAVCRTEDEFKRFIQRSLHQYADQKSMNCAIEYRGNIVGTAGFNSIDFELRKVEIGYWMAENAQGNGVMTRVCRYLIDYAFCHLAMEKVEISAATNNRASRAVCERLGMKLEGIITNEERVNNRILDHAVYGLHRPETD
jgi:ribosomal-protein-serine acetyltransferase